jgi:hypothetical protein
MNKKPVVIETVPVDWTSQQESIAKDALTVLCRHYPGYKWGVEWTECLNSQLGVLVIRLLDMPTDAVYLINPKDIDRDRMRCAMRAGGEFLEALGLTARAARHDADKVHSLKRTPAGLIVPHYAAVPEHNPGYARFKDQSSK